MTNEEHAALEQAAESVIANSTQLAFREGNMSLIQRDYLRGLLVGFAERMLTEGIPALTFKLVSALEPPPETQPNGDIILDLPSVHLRYSPKDKQITACDKLDRYNEPACYTTHKRNITKVWAAVVAQSAMLTNMTHQDVMNVFTEHGMRYHYWCRMD